MAQLKLHTERLSLVPLADEHLPFEQRPKAQSAADRVLDVAQTSSQSRRSRTAALYDRWRLDQLDPGKRPPHADASLWAKAIAGCDAGRVRPGRPLCRQCSRATSADRIAKAIVPVGDIA
jgi:hypothetical protein